jgi:hypothetical protein
VPPEYVRLTAKQPTWYTALGIGITNVCSGECIQSNIPFMVAESTHMPSSNLLSMKILNWYHEMIILLNIPERLPISSLLL